MSKMVKTVTALFVVVGFATALHAHMALSKSMPEADATLSDAPAHIQLWFTQDPDPAVSRITLEGPSGEVELGDLMIHEDKSIMAAPKSALGPGTYTVGWRSAGDDGHVQRGNYVFTIAAAD